MARNDDIGAERRAALALLESRIVECRACPRLVEWREQVAREKRAAFRSETYWGKPVPGFGDPDARIVIVGLAPAAHGANRTGRMFTGDRSGDFLYAALHRRGFANQPAATHIGDGLELSDVYVAAPVRCAPPANKPSVQERDNCAPFLAEELDLLRPRAVIALGAFGWDAALRTHAAITGARTSPKPRFAHGAEVSLDAWTLLGCYHVSQQNTFTGRLTPEMLDEILSRAAELAR